MPEPLSYQVLRTVRDILQTIRRSSGYYSDAGAAVYLEPMQEPADSGPILVVTATGFQRPNDPAMLRIGRGFDFRITALVPARMNEAELRLHEILDDIDRAMAGQQTKFPDGTRFPMFVGAARIPPADGLAWIGVNVDYVSTVRRTG